MTLMNDYKRDSPVPQNGSGENASGEGMPPAWRKADCSIVLVAWTGLNAAPDSWVGRVTWL